MQPHLLTGQRVRLSATSPIESEGVAPGPGHVGVLVAPPAGNDKRRCWAVRFEGLSLIWHIPEHLLEQLDEVSMLREQRKSARVAA